MPKFEESALKSGLQTARTFGTLFSDFTLHQKLLSAKTVKQIRDLLVEERRNMTLVMDEIMKKARENQEADEACAADAAMNAWEALPEKVKSKTQPPNLDTIRHLTVKTSADKQAGHQDLHGNEPFYAAFAGIVRDFKARYPYWLTDWTDTFMSDASECRTIFTATIFIYLACLLPTIGFGNANYKTTDGYLTVEKSIIAQTFGGLFFSLFSSQPLLILLTTAPITLYVHIISDISNQMDFEFSNLYVLVGLWNAFFLAVYAITNSAKYMKYSTRSLDETFMIFTAFAFFFEAYKHMKDTYLKYYLGLEKEYPAFNETDNLKTRMLENINYLISTTGASLLDTQLVVEDVVVEDAAMASYQYVETDEKSRDVFLLPG